jgi:DNA modification methylase
MIDLRQGDAYKLIKEIPDKSIDCIYTDIPYLITAGGANERSSALSKRMHKKMYSDLINIKDGIDYSILDDFVRVMKKVNLFIWCSKMQILDIMNYFKEYNFEILVWCKTNPSPTTNNVWLPDIEYCLYFREKGVKLYDGYEHKTKWYVSGINKSDKDKFIHPTIKPYELVVRHLKHTTKEGDLILDMFMGSGTTGVACQTINRDFIGIELEEEYFRIAGQRIKGYEKVTDKNIELINLFSEGE